MTQGVDSGNPIADHVKILLTGDSTHESTRDAFDRLAATRDIPSRMEQFTEATTKYPKKLWKAGKTNALKLWHTGDNYPEVRTAVMILVILALVAVGIVAFTKLSPLVMAKIQPWIDWYQEMEGRLIPDSGMHWFHLIIMMGQASDAIEGIASR